MRSDEELKKIALGIFKGEIFTSWNIRPEDQHLLPLIFMPLGFIKPEQIKELEEKKIVAVFEYLDKALPKTVNGYPIFMSCQLLTQEEAEKVIKYYNEIKKKVSDVVEEVEE